MSLTSDILNCFSHLFYKIKIHCKCSKCCESDCVSQTDNISLNSKPDTEDYKKKDILDSKNQDNKISSI
jgi:hypothetical protein